MDDVRCNRNDDAHVRKTQAVKAWYHEIAIEVDTVSLSTPRTLQNKRFII
jgi:hypothetical protein